MAKISLTVDDGKTYASIGDLRNWEQNPRRITKENFNKLKYRLERFGEFRPILIEMDGLVIGGNQRLRAMAELGYSKCWVSVVIPTSEAERIEYAISDNEQQGTWLELELSELILPHQNEIELKEYSIALGKNVGLDTLLSGFGGGDNTEQGKLTDTFIVPPFSILDTRQGYWQERKAYWMRLIEDKGESRDGVLSGVKEGEESKSAMAKMAGASILDPVLAEIITRWFNVEGGTALDPFAGDTVFGFVSAYAGNAFTGIELRKEQAELNQGRVDAFKLPAKYICDDGQNVGKHAKKESTDLVFSCPPYFDLEVYSDLPNDASNQKNYQGFTKILSNALTGALEALKQDRFAVIVISDVRDKQGIYRGIPAYITECMKRAGAMLYNDIILVNAVGTAAVRAGRSMRNRKVVRMHQNVLVFYKGDPKKIKENYPALAFSEVEEE